ncbi:MAG: TRM11 family SAM-dependent methyltransferase [Thermocladium sp.]
MLKLRFRNMVGEDLPVKELLSVSHSMGINIIVMKVMGYEALIDIDDLTKAITVFSRLVLIREVTDDYGIKIYRRQRQLLNDPGKPHLDTDIAMLMLNLTGVVKDDAVLDPFSGIGTISLVAKRLGVNVVSIDISSDFIDARGDATLLPIRQGSLNAIVTDPPFNRLHTVNSRLDHIYRQFLFEASSTLKRCGRLSFVYPSYLSEYVEDALMETDLDLYAYGVQYINDAFSRVIIALTKAGDKCDS